MIENPQPHGKSYNKWRGGEAKLCNRDLLRAAIDAALSKKPKDFEAFLKLLESSGYKVKRGKNITFAHEGQKQNIRLRSLGTGYSEEELRSVIAGSKTHIPKKKKKYLATPKPRLITSIEESLNSGKGAAYDNKIKVSMLKEMAHTFLYLEEQDFPDYEALAASVDDSKAKFYALSEKIKAAEKRMAEIAVLKTHIINYSKTREVFDGYKASRYSKKYLAEHETDIILHRAAKKAFNELGMTKLPTVKSLQAEYSTLLSEKKAAYAEYHSAKAEMEELLVHRQNYAQILELDTPQAQKEKEHDRS